LARGFADATAVPAGPFASDTPAHRFCERLGLRAVERRFGEDDCFVYRLERAR